jgi:4'-phosphopantetheinyl transferase
VSIDALAEDPSQRQRAFACLTAPERERFARFRHDDDRWMFALGRMLARDMVGTALGIGPSEWQWREGPHGRPEIDRPATDVHFNLSHSAGLVACAIGRGRELGVDLEHVHRRPPDPAIVDRYLSPVEAADVRHQGQDWIDRFLLYWTLKEAYLKARGLGISVPLSDITFRLDGIDAARIEFDGALAGTSDGWTFQWRRLAPRHLVALAASTESGPVAFELDTVG